MNETLTIEAAREQASALHARKGGKAITLRSCWVCNPAHEHLRDPEWTEHIIACFGCGHFYYRGLDITAEDAPSTGDGEPA